MRREASRVSLLICPFCVRDVVPITATQSGWRLGELGVCLGNVASHLPLIRAP